MSTAVDVAGRLARCLDAEDYRGATELLGDRCEYVCRGEEYHGPTAIIETYRSNGESARREFDRIEYESAVHGLSDRSAEIHFVDRLCRNGEWHTFQCRQIVEVGGDGRIVRIEHVDLPGQREALAEYRRRFGPAETSG
jgi:hypothetical protein